MGQVENQTDYIGQVRTAVLDESTFMKLTMNGQINGEQMPWRRVIIRPVLIKNKRQWQFSYFDAKQDTTKNYKIDEVNSRLDEVLRLPFRSFQLETTTGETRIQIGNKGKVNIQHIDSDSTVPVAEISLAHDASKKLPFPLDKPDSYLHAVGIMDAQGKIRPGMHDKFSQINEFIKLIEHTGEIETLAAEKAAQQKTVNILDCGCGSSYLTFAVYHYFNHLRGIPAHLVGIDTNKTLIDKSTAQAQTLGYDGMQFVHAPISEYIPETSPDIVIALHACDTATDDSIAQGIRAGARMVFCAPCCHHDLNKQLQAVDPFRPVLRHGILKQRMADILTDTFRALALRIMGYKTDVIEFVSSEHTNRNLMIRAVKRTQPGEAEFIREYEELKAFWSVTPYIETLIGSFTATHLEHE